MKLPIIQLLQTKNQLPRLADLQFTSPATKAIYHASNEIAQAVRGLDLGDFVYVSAHIKLFAWVIAVSNLETNHEGLDLSKTIIDLQHAGSAINHMKARWIAQMRCFQMETMVNNRERLENTFLHRVFDCDLSGEDLMKTCQNRESMQIEIFAISRKFNEPRKVA